MNGQMQSKMISLVLYLSLIIIVAVGVRAIIINPHNDYSIVCSFEYGENWVHENTEYFGDTCIHLDYVTLEVLDRRELNLTNKEIIDKYCDRVPMFNLRRWDSKCFE